MQRKLFALLTTLFLVCVAAPGRTGDTATSKVQLMDFEQQTGIVLGYPDGQPPLGWYRATQHTEFVPGPPSSRFPPRPCRGLAHAWNMIVRLQPPSDFVAQLKQQALIHLLYNMSLHQCNVTIQNYVGETPADIVQLNPTP